MKERQTPSPEYHDQLIIPSDQTYLHKVEKFVVMICKRAGLTNDQGDNMAIAITELVNNGIIHANQFASDKTVTIEASYLDKCLLVRVVDQGSGFDPDVIANPVNPENLWKLGGRGIFLVRNLIDEVEILPTSKGTTVILREYIEQS